MHICRYMTYHQAYVFTHVEKFCWKLWLILTRTFLTIFHKASILCFLLKLLRDFFWWWWRNCQKEFCSEEFVMWKFSPFYASKGSKSIFESSKTQALLQVRKAFNALTATQTHNESKSSKKVLFRAVALRRIVCNLAKSLGSDMMRFFQDDITSRHAGTCWRWQPKKPSSYHYLMI